MKEQIIDISGRAIRAPSRFELARVGAMMLFPDDERKRRCYEESDAALMVCETQQLPEILQWPMREITDLSRARFAQGILAGFVLYEALAGAGSGEILGRLVPDLKRDPRNRFARFSRNTFNNDVWPLFRSVAHFWAATFMAIKLKQEPFPCALDSFMDYLATVEAFRIAGETTKGKQSPEPSILRPDETVKLSAKLQIQPADLRFSPR